jgi:hypothetical protein
MIMFKICNILITVPTSITKVKLIDFNNLVYKLFNIIPSMRNLHFNVKVAFDGNGFGDGDLVDSDSCFVHRENKIQEDSVAVKLFLKLLFAGINLAGVNLFRNRIEISPEFADFDCSFHTSSNSLLEF